MTKITFKYQNEKEVTVDVTEELSVLQIAHDNDINLEGGIWKCTPHLRKFHEKCFFSGSKGCMDT